MATTVATKPARLSNLIGPVTVESLVFALSLATGPILSRSLGDDGRGSLAAVLVPTQLAWWGLGLGVPYASGMLSKKMGRANMLNGAWGITALIGLPVLTILYFLAPTLLAEHPDVALGWFRFALVVIMVALPTGTALHLRLMEHGATWGLSSIKSMHLFVNMLVVVGLALADRLTLTTALASWLVSFAISRVLILWGMKGWPTGLPTASVMRSQLRVGRASAVVTIATVSLGRIDQVFLSFLATSAELGVYVVAATAAQVSLPVARGIADVVLPDAFARPDADISGRAIAFIFAASAAIGLASAAVAPWLIPALFGEPFRPSVEILWLLIPGQVMFNTGWVISAKHLGNGRPGIAARAIAVAAALNLIALAPAIIAFGPYGAAVLTSVCQTLFLAAVWKFRTRL